jgi:hypothetical protein
MAMVIARKISLNSIIKMGQTMVCKLYFNKAVFITVKNSVKNECRLKRWFKHESTCLVIMRP